MTKTAVIPPRAPRYKSIIRLQRFMKNPIPFMNDNLAKYGDTYSFSLRYNKSNILTIDPEVIQHILRKNADNYEKPEETSDSFGRFIGEGLLIARGKKHTDQRKLMAPGFRPRSLSNLIDLMDHEIDNYFDELDTRITDSVPITIDDEMRNLTFRVMSKANYGDDMDQIAIQKFSKRFQEIQSLLVKLARLPSLLKFYNATGKTKYYDDIAKENDQVLLDIISRRREEDPKDDLLGMLMASKYENSEDGMSNQQLKDESLVLFVAGHETASNILSWIFYILSKHPETIQRIKSEFESLLEGQVPTFGDLMKMEFLGQVIDECLRMYPPSWITSRIAKEDDEINGFFIPKGSRVIPFIYGLHHNKKLWENPDQFNPKRFSKEARMKRHNFAHMPFGAGPRMCIGRNFAMMEMKMIVIKLLKRYDFSLVPNQKIAMLPAVTLKPRYGIKLNFSKVN